MNDKIVNKIKNLLDLSKSSNEHEAKLALSKAYELMVKYNIEEREVQKETSEVIKYSTSIYYTAYKNNWLNEASHKLADLYGCVSYVTRPLGSEKFTIALMGFEENCKIIESLLLFIKSHVDSWFTDYRRANKHRYLPEYIQQARNNYGQGFTYSIVDKLEQHKHQVESESEAEHGLVISVPQEALEFRDSLYVNDFKISSIDNEGFTDGLHDGFQTSIHESLM